MARKTKRASKRRSKASPGTTQSPLQLLKADHDLVKELFATFERTRADQRKRDLAAQICEELRVHAQLEEEIVYPAAREALRQTELVDEAAVEHDVAKKLIDEIENATAQDELVAAKVKVLAKLVTTHIREEQNKLFPLLRKARLDMRELAARLAARKVELTEG